LTQERRTSLRDADGPALFSLLLVFLLRHGLDDPSETSTEVRVDHLRAVVAVERLAHHVADECRGVPPGRS